MTNSVNSTDIDTFARVLVSGGWTDATRLNIDGVRTHLTETDPTSLKLLVDTAERAKEFLDAILTKIGTIEWVQFTTSELVLMLMQLPETTRINKQLTQIAECKTV